MNNEKKIYVLDTSVILHDYNAIYNFQEHDVAIPITVLEEIDDFKKGDSVINYHAREFIRSLDSLEGPVMNDWVSLNGSGQGHFKVLIDMLDEPGYELMFSNNKADNRILNSAVALARNRPDRDVILVTKDINLRVKARALELRAEDYRTGKVKDVEHLYRGKLTVEDLPRETIDQLFDQGRVPVSRALEEEPEANQYLILKSESTSALGYYHAPSESIERVHVSQTYGISPRNAEQTFALHALLHDELQLVSISGPSGTGKTLLALAGSLDQRTKYKQIYLARPIVPLSNRDIGYLPGDAHEKIGPYMQPLWDNLNFIRSRFGENDKEHQRIKEMIESEKLHITPLAYIRGRSLSNIIFIIDEAQNLSPHEVKTIITRAGEGTKIIFTGDVHQIDTPYLDSQSNGLSYLIDRMKGNGLYAHINLEKGERSELSELASRVL